MENLELNKQEKDELEKRGFLIKKILSFKYFFINTLIGSSFLSIIIFPTILYFGGLEAIILSEQGSVILLWCIIFIFPLLFLGLVNYGFSSKIFYNKKSKLWSGGKINNEEIEKKRNGMLIFLKTLEVIGKGRGETKNNLEYIITGVAGLGLLVPITILEYSIFYYGIIAIIIILGLFLNKLVNIISPLYAFGNIGEKIQSLTPRIEEQSKLIQKGFKKNMNFSVLSDGFDSLSTTFTDIVTLVIKLEKVETRANKGNLFDSEKYINSLRSDIVTPLNSLRTFLEKQKTELLESQKELTRVVVGGREGTGNMELQSKRSESLIQELTENIEKLDVMIGKIW